MPFERSGLETLAEELLRALGLSENAVTSARVRTVVFYLKLFIRLWGAEPEAPEVFPSIPGADDPTKWQ